MSTSKNPPTTLPAATRTKDAAPWVEESALPQLSLGGVVAVWALAAIPMGTLAWVVAPWVADRLDGPAAMFRALLVSLTVGLLWQFVLVVLLVYREQRSLRWPVVKEALWLHAPRSPKTGRVGGWLWLVLVPCMLLFAAEEFIPSFSPVAGHDLPTFLESSAGSELFSGSWGWFALVVGMALLNTVLGEELLFRGFLLPRMHGVFGRGDWVANGVLFAAYHLHMPWSMPVILVDTLAISYPSRRYRSALIGIAVHSAQSVVIIALVLALVLQG